MRQYRQAILFVNRGSGLGQREITRHRLSHPQAQHVPLPAADFHPRHNVEGVVVTVGIRPQAGLQRIVVGHGDHIQPPLNRHVIEQFLNGWKTIAGDRMHVQVSPPAALSFH